MKGGSVSCFFSLIGVYLLSMKKNKTEVIKHSSTIQVSNKVTLLQRKCWNVLLSNAFDDLPKKFTVLDVTDLFAEELKDWI